MAYTLSPSTLPATNEKTQLSQTVSVVAGGMDPPVSSIVVTKTGDSLGNIVINVSSSSFVITGQYYDNWEQSITYEEYTESGNISVVVPQFSNISPNLNFVTSFVAATSPSTKTATYYVLVNASSNLSITQTININYTPNKDLLVDFVGRGKY